MAPKSDENEEWPIQSATSLDTTSLSLGENYARELGRTSKKSLLFQEHVYELCKKGSLPGPLSRWCRFYSRSLEDIGSDSTYLKKAAWLGWSASPLNMVALIAAVDYAKALGSESDESILFQEEVYTRCQAECTAEEFGYWCIYYSKSLEAIGKDSTFVKEAAWLKRSAISLDSSSLLLGEQYATALGRTCPKSLLLQHQVWVRCLKEAEDLAHIWGQFYSESLTEAEGNSELVDDNPLSKPQTRGPPRHPGSRS